MTAAPATTRDPSASGGSTAGQLIDSVRAQLGLLAGLAGLTVALATALGPWRDNTMAQTGGIVTVDGRAISRATYDRAIAALEADKRNPVSDADRRMALSRLIDEELLVRRSLDLGLAETEPTVRKALVDAMLQLASVPAAEREPGDADLRRFYDERPTLLAAEPRLTISMVGYGAAAKTQSDRMAGLLRAGVDFDKAASETGAEALADPPALSSPRKLTDYAGPAVSEAVRALEPGEAVGPLEIGGRLVFAVVRARAAADRPAFESVRDDVRDAWRRTAKDRALENYLARLRNRAQIVLAPDAPH